MQIEELRDRINNEGDNLVERVNAWRAELLSKLDEVSRNEILRAIQNINARLTKIEARLPEEVLVVDED